ncbi:PASTA domain-containing protein [Arthrobacter sp. B1805]|uniref:PASTA domain-containing protein n=1 Tax=Arthrobacter sp. B1805 TaxID=2058892 RepID=UPI0015E44F1D|nr:PASTA domain-containing protein [Arthrobacter sp. B1805]
MTISTILVITSCSNESPVTMPDVVGKTLDVAISDVERAGISDEVDVLGGGMFGIVDESNWIVCSQEPATGDELSDPPRVTVERECVSGEASASAVPTATAKPTSDAEVAAPTPDETDTSSYLYQGPTYEVVSVDSDQTPAQLDQYWVFTDALDYSTDAYKDQIKLLIADVARTSGTNEILVEIVTDREIAEAESPSKTLDFIEENGEDYFLNVIPQKETTGWVASYTGGFDRDSGEASSSPEAFEVIWFIAADAEFETWMPVQEG